MSHFFQRKHYNPKSENILDQIDTFADAGRQEKNKNEIENEMGGPVEVENRRARRLDFHPPTRFPLVHPHVMQSVPNSCFGCNLWFKSLINRYQLINLIYVLKT